MSNEVDSDYVVDVKPIGMMIHALSYNSYAGHETESFGKILELKFFEKLAFDDHPTIKRSKSFLKFRLFK